MSPASSSFFHSLSSKFSRLRFGVVILALIASLTFALARSQTAQATYFYAMDLFGTIAYTNNDGTVNWAGNWVETNDTGGAGGGNVQVIAGELRVSSRATTNDGDFESVQRAINLATMLPGQPLLTFTYRQTNLDATDTLTVDVFNGTVWTTLETITGNSTVGTRVYDLSAYANANSAIRFATTANFDQTDESVFFDNIKVSYFTTSSHTAVDILQTVQTYYIPVAEDQALLMMDTINAAANSPTSVYVSISINSDGTVLYYDHWEDDFEGFINDPNQATTEVWGDNDTTNGMPPGYTSDILDAGDIIIINNWVPTDHLDWIDFDGGDKIASTEAIAVTRTSWASGSGTLHGGSVEMLDTSIWGTRYDLPVHDTTFYDFTYAGVALMAGEDGTSIYRNGAFVATINEGQSYMFNDTVAVGDMFTSSAPVQANLLAGNIGSNYASDWLTLYPFDILGTSYYAPVNSNSLAATTAVYLHNPNDSAITVNWDTSGGAQTAQNIAAHQGVRVTMPTIASGAHFYSTSVFQAISLINSGGQANDWGYTLIPENQLTQQAMVGWGVGRDPTSATNPAENGSPVWVIAVGTGTINVCADYDGDGVGSLTDGNGYNYDQLLALSNLGRATVYDTDGDQTGMLLYLCNGSETGNVNKIAVAWGQDPATATAGAPGLDVGTSVPPLPNFTATKGAELVVDLNGNTRFDVRDTFAYQIVIKNVGALPIPSGSIVVSDIVPNYTSYIPNSTALDDGTPPTTAIPDNITPATVFPLDEGGYTVNQILPIGGVFTVTFEVQIDPSIPGLVTIQNNAQVSGLDLEYDPHVEIIVQPPNVTNAIGNRVWVDENSDGLQDPGEPGLPNVTVQLYDATGVTLLASTVTDLEGNYLFPNLDSDTYRVQVLASSLPSGLTVSTLGTPGADYNNQAQPYTVTVGGNENMTADFGYNWASTGNVNGNTGTGAIGDRLWVDTDGDGVQDPGEPGLSGITVSLLTDDNGDGTYGGTGDNPPTTTTTNAAGFYIFTNLPAGGYVVEVNNGTTPTGYTPTGDPDTTLDNRTSSPVVLAPGDVFLHADFGYQPTGTSGTIGDVIWFNPDGNGTQDTGEYGLAGITVALIRDTNGNGIWDAGEAIIASDVTDANGTYSFTGLPLDDGDGDADYLVWVNDTENVLGELSPNYDADGLGNPASGLATTGVSAVAISAGTPTNNNQDFGYGPKKVNPAEVGVIGDTVFLDRNGNNAYDPGEGLENVVVELYNNLGTLITDTHTTETGYYAFGGLADGTYTVKVVTTSLPNSGAGLTNSVDPDGGSNSQSSVTLSAGNRINLSQDFGYASSNPGTISGTLWIDTDADGTLDGGETSGFSGVTVALYDSLGNIVATTTTDGSGNYSFNNLPAGTYTVHVTDQANTLNGYWHSVGSTPGADNYSQTDPYTVVLAAGGTNTTADFGYYRTPASIGDFVWEDLNRNGIQDGEPGIPNVIVQLTITWPGGAGTTTLTTVTDSNGAYNFGNLLLDEDMDGAGAGEPTFLVTFTTPTNYLPTLEDQGGNDALDSDGLTETVVPVEGQTIMNVDSGFYQVVNIGDRIWLDLDGDGTQDAAEPGLSGVVVELSDGTCTVGVGGDCPTATTDTNGNYNFLGLAPGTYTVIVRTATLPVGVNQTGDPDEPGIPCTTCDSQSTVVATTPGTYDAIDFGYQGTASIADYVWNDQNGNGTQDGSESGISGVTVWVDLNNNGVQDPTEPADVTDGNGNYLIAGLPVGTYSVRTTGTPIAGATPTFDLDGTGTANQASVSLTAGQNRTDVDWGYQFAALSITKTSNAAGTVGTLNPGESFQYTLVIRNNTASLQTGIAVTDAVPVGASYVPESTLATGYQISSGTANYRDEFNVRQYSNNNGTSGWTWTGDWQEVGETDGALAGYIQVFDDGTGAPREFVTGFNKPNNDNTNITRRLYRQASLSTCVSATLTFDYRRVDPEVGENVIVEASTDNNSYTTLFTITGANTTDANYIASGNISLNTYALGNVYLRFSATFGGNSQDAVYIDNVQIACNYQTVTAITLDNNPISANPALANGIPATLVTSADNFSLNPGQEMTVVFQVTVNDSIPSGMTTIDNIASVVSNQQLTPQTASHNDPLALANVGDRVWYDTDGNGSQDGGEPGVSGVVVHLYDPGPNGTPGGGDDILIDTTTTDANGNYLFNNKVVDSYFVQVDLPTGYSFTTQDAGDNTLDSDVNTSGTSTLFTLVESTTDTSVDAGLANSQLDYGDLPASYDSTILGEDGARHLVGTLRLGPTADTDPEGQETNAANGDDNDGNNDDDGVTRDMSDHWLNNAVVDLLINLQGTGTADVGVWLDWNGDGDFGDASEFFAFPGLPTGSTTPVQITVPAVGVYTVGNPVNVRVRAFDPVNLIGGSLDAADSVGYALNGEVEDYQWDFDAPTAVTLESLRIRQASDMSLGLLIVSGFVTLAVLVFIRKRALSRGEDVR